MAPAGLPEEDRDGVDHVRPCIEGLLAGEGLADGMTIVSSFRPYSSMLEGGEDLSQARRVVCVSLPCVMYCICI